MTKRLYELLGMEALSCNDNDTCPELPYPVHLGVEIEAEGVRDAAWTVPDPHWRAVNDGSLRNSGVEFVFRRPLTPKEAVAALTEFDERGATYDYSKRTSVHVHVNVLDISSPALLRFIILYLIFERVLYNRFGASRYSNNFCVPAHVNESLLAFLSGIDRRRVVKHILQRERSGRAGNGLKYGGINLSSLGNYGTLEFRFCAGTHEKETILLLVNVLCALRQYAVRKTEISRYIDEASDGNMSNLLYKVLPPQVVAQLGTYDELRELCVDGARVVERILHEQDLSAVATRLVGNAPNKEPERVRKIWDGNELLRAVVDQRQALRDRFIRADDEGV